MSALDAACLQPVVSLADLVRRLVVNGRAALGRAVREPEPRAVPWALDAAIDDRALPERAAGMGARLMERLNGRSLANEHEIVDADRAPHRLAVDELVERQPTVDLEREPFRPGTAEGVPADHVAEDVDDLPADVRTRGQDEEADDRQHDRHRPIDRIAVPDQQ